MGDTYTELIWAALAFLTGHLAISPTPLRGQLTRMLGAKLYTGLYSLIALGTLVWMVLAFNAAPHEVLWSVPPGLRYLPLVVMPLVLLLLVGGMTPNPTGMGGESQAIGADPARGTQRITRHPVNMGIALWAILHIAASGELRGVLFFGALWVLAVVGPLSIDHRRARETEGWERYTAVTSVLPFAAILAGRNRFVPEEIGYRSGTIALGLYVLLLFIHPYLFGVQAF